MNKNVRFVGKKTRYFSKLENENIWNFGSIQQFTIKKTRKLVKWLRAGMQHTHTTIKTVQLITHQIVVFVAAGVVVVQCPNENILPARRISFPFCFAWAKLDQMVMH